MATTEKSESKFVKIYDLREDKGHVSLVQDATLYSKEFGLQPEHGLFGTKEWWAAVKSGAIPTILYEGTISRVYASGHNDFSQFELTSERGKTSWERLGNNSYYVVGRRIKVLCAIQKFKKPLPEKQGRETPFTEVVLEIWAEVTLPLNTGPAS